MRESLLKSLHPSVSVTYFVLLICITMFSLHPIVLLFSFGMAIIAVVRIYGVRRLAFLFWVGFPMFVFAVVLLPLFNHNGVTPLFYINDMAVTLENIVYGSFMTIMLITVTAWLLVAGSVIDSEKLLYVFGRFSPKTALVISMVLRFVPMLVQRFREIHEAQRGMLYLEGKGVYRRTKQFAKELSILLSWCLENSIDTSISMESRGYGIQRRSSYHRFCMKKRDVSLLFVFLFLGGISLSAICSGCLGVYYFPKFYLEEMNCFALLAVISQVLLMGAAYQK